MRIIDQDVEPKFLLYGLQTSGDAGICQCFPDALLIAAGAAGHGYGAKRIGYVESSRECYEKLSGKIRALERKPGSGYVVSSLKGKIFSLEISIAVDTVCKDLAS